MDSYIRQIKSIDIAPLIPDNFIMNCDNDNVRSDTSKRKREDFGLEDIRIRVENLLGLANNLVNHDKSCRNIKSEESKSFGEYPSLTEQSQAIIPPSRIPRRSQSLQETPNSCTKSRSVTPQRIVQSRIQYYEGLVQSKDIYKTVLSQERELGIQRTSIPISVNIKTSKRGYSLNADIYKMPLFGEVTSTQDRSVFVFAAPTPVRSIPRFVKGKNASGSGHCQAVKKKIPLRNYNPNAPSKIPVFDKSKFFAGDSTMSINRKTG